jgi:hypothetical protein
MELCVGRKEAVKRFKFHQLTRVVKWKLKFDLSKLKETLFVIPLPSGKEKV